MEYNVDYFIKKLSIIPDELWHVGNLQSYSSDAKCVNGLCGAISYSEGSKETKELIKIMHPLNLRYLTGASVVQFGMDGICTKSLAINDGITQEYQQPTPKQRILAALYDIKKMQEPVKVIYKVVEVDKHVKNLTKQEIILS